MSWGIVAGAAVGLVGSAMSADAAGDAADQQAQSAKEATAAQERMFERQVELQRPWRDTGGAGLNRLAYELGLSPTGSYTGQAGPATAAAPAAAPQMETEAQIRARLSPQYRTAAPAADPNATATGDWAAWYSPEIQQMLAERIGATSAQPQANSADLEAAVQAELSRQQMAMQQRQGETAAATAQASTDPAYGNLLRTFGQADFEVDPGYAFRQEEGNRAMTRAAAAGGGLGSGKFLKDAMRFNQGLASQEYGAAFDRFNVGQTNKFNRLASISGIGQTAANQTGAAAANFGSQIGSNIIGAGNALAAGRVGGANAWSNGLSNASSMYQNHQMMNRFFPQNGGGWQPNTGGTSNAMNFQSDDYGQYF